MTHIPDEAVQAAFEAMNPMKSPSECCLYDVKKGLEAAIPYLSAPCAVEVLALDWTLFNSEKSIWIAESPLGLQSRYAESAAAAQADFERRILSCVVTKPVDVAAMREAAEQLIRNRFDTYTAKNGKRISIEGDDGEKCWIVSFEDMHDLENALRALSAEPEQGEQSDRAALAQGDELCR